VADYFVDMEIFFGAGVNTLKKDARNEDVAGLLYLIIDL
jgi:hypothetical protein